MKKFLVLYESPVPATEQMAKASPEQAKAGMDQWMAWAKKAGTAIVDMGAPLGRAAAVEGGSSPGSAGKVTGFSILEGESTKQVQQLLKEHPHFRAPGASIEVLEFLSMPGMPQS
ncbi:MAG TPA: hypothetical protein VE964_11145 [Myxococcales bacterium]|nr:hypothetical protein [Myxococcales bacterium]